MEHSNHQINDTDEKKRLLARQAVSFAKGLVRDGVKGLPRNIVARSINLAAMDAQHDVSDPAEYAHKFLKQAYVQLDAYSTWERMTETYGKSWFDWEPETIWQTLYHDYTHEPDRNAKDMILALQVLCKTNFAFEDWHVFEKTVHALNMNHVTFEHVQVAELDEIAYAIVVMNKIRPKATYEDDVLAYIAASANHCGVVYLPDDLFPAGCQNFIPKNNEDLIEATKNAYGKITKHDTETALGVQLARLHEIKESAKLD